MKYFLCFSDFAGCSFSTLAVADEMEPFRPATMAGVSSSFTGRDFFFCHVRFEDLLTQDSLSQPVDSELGFPDLVRDPRAPAWPARVSQNSHPVQPSSAMERVNAGMGVGTGAMRSAIGAPITRNPSNNGSGAGSLFLGECSCYHMWTVIQDSSEFQSFSSSGLDELVLEATDEACSIEMLYENKGLKTLIVGDVRN
ncbi:hypothetical protein NE237_031067 [Protea cynaroides]|uniref:Uncharacterized protein n=1 Tax=Protea cynaroides TaxID=273540 RepID=A0A9Q0R1S2_9MAGN|nr:hypothetical protein NE237_031067 [Protea cynaroides]